jgi:predicted metalloprotease with PDZ domain
MPEWSPGYDGIGDYSRNLSNIRVEDGARHALPFEKTAKNTWRVATGNSPAIVLHYDVFGATSFAANTYA